MPDDSETTLTTVQARIEDYLVDCVRDGETFFKSRTMEDDLPYSASQIGVNITVLREKTTRLEITEWAGSANASTWQVTLTEEEQDNHPSASSSSDRSTAAD